MASPLRHRITPQPLHQRALPVKRLEGGLHRGVLIVAGDVEEEDVVPWTQAARTRLDAREVELALVEGLQRAEQRTRLVAEGHEEARLVVSLARRAGGFAPKNAEARRIVLLVLNVAGLDRHAVTLGGQRRRDGRGVLLLRGV